MKNNKRAGGTVSGDRVNAVRAVGVPEGLVVCVAEGADEEKARMLAQSLGVELLCDERGRERQGLALRLDDKGLALVDGALALRADLTALLPRLKPGCLQRELLVRAARVKGGVRGHRAVDATAGLGEDALLLAAAGFEVRLFECNPVIAALLEDALRRAALVPGLAAVVGRMQLAGGDSVSALPTLPEQPEVVLLDPMFPARRKSASVKKKFQLLQQLETPCEDEEALMAAAFAAHPRKVVVKRPAKGPHLAGRKPSYTLTGKAIRYDCYVQA